MQKWNTHGQNKPHTILARIPPKVSCLKKSFDGDILERKTEKNVTSKIPLRKKSGKTNFFEKPFRMKGKFQEHSNFKMTIYEGNV